MDKVYLKKATEYENDSATAGKLTELFKVATDGNRLVSEDHFLPIKIHFGEKNNTGHIKPDYIQEPRPKVRVDFPKKRTGLV